MLRALPFIVFSFMSHHTLLDVSSEIQTTRKNKIIHILRWETFFLTIIYVLVGVVPYLHFGDEILKMKEGSNLLAYDFGCIPMIICNSLMILFLFISNILKFRPARDIVTCLLRDRYRESALWNAFSITALHILLIIISIFAIKLNIKLTLVCTLIGIICAPLISFILPFITYYKVFYSEQSKRNRVFFYLFLALLGIGIHVSPIIYVMTIIFND